MDYKDLERVGEDGRSAGYIIETYRLEVDGACVTDGEERVALICAGPGIDYEVMLSPRMIARLADIANTVKPFGCDDPWHEVSYPSVRLMKPCPSCGEPSRWKTAKQEGGDA